MMNTIEYATLLEKLEALKAHLLDTGRANPMDLRNLTPENCYYDRWSIFSILGDEYKVLTEEEADAAAREEILETLWAFKPEFVVDYAPFSDSITYRERDAIVDCFEKMACHLCESMNPLYRALLGDLLEDFIDQAIFLDGRGHFLAHYDGEENESADGKYLIYWVN